ncbi:MAG: hypothetical protein Kow00133_06470 [Amphiplicatus sp.]
MGHLFIRVCLLAASAALVGCLSPAAPTSAASYAAAGESSAPANALIVRGDRLFVPARFNGRQVEALLDSGAEMTILDRAFAEELGVVATGSHTARGTGGETEAAFAKGVDIEAAGVELVDRIVAVIDLSDIAERLVKASVPAIIGRDLFDAARFEIDIEAGRIEKTDRAAAPSGARLPMETHKGLQTIPVSVEGNAPAQADFDLGNGGNVLVGAAYAERLGLTAPGRIVDRQTGGGLGGEIARDIVVLKTLEIAGETFTDVPAAIDPTENAADVNVGVRILRRFRMTVDFAENALWVEPR